MLYEVATVVGLEGLNDALVHGLGNGGGVRWKKEELDGLQLAVDIGMDSAVVQDKGHLPLLLVEDPVLLVKPVAKEVASDPGLLVCMELHWQLMDVDPLLAEDLWLPVVVDDQGLQLVCLGLWVLDMLATDITVILDFEHLPPLLSFSLKTRKLLHVQKCRM